MMRALFASIVLACMVIPQGASADGYGGDPPNVRQLALYRAQMEFDLDLHINMTDDFVGEPIALSPSFYYGFTDKLSGGISTNPYQHLGLFGGAGFLFNDGGDDVFNNLTIDVLYLLLDDANFALALRGGIDFMSLDPFSIHFRAGVRGRLAFADRFAFVFEPSLSVGDDDVSPDVFMDLPAWLLFQATVELAVGGVMGFRTDFDNANLFLGFTLIYTPRPNIDVGLLFVFPAIDETGRLRSLTFNLALRF